MFHRAIFLFSVIVVSKLAMAQQPNYTFKHFVRKLDSAKFKFVEPKKDGTVRTYLESDGVEIFDVDDDNTTYVRGSQPVLLCIEGPRKHFKREGVFSFYVIDSLDHSKRYKLWEQDFSKDKLNGQWRTYTLKGTLVKYETFKDDEPNGVARTFWIDGKRIMEEKEFFGDSMHFIQRAYYDNGKVKEEVPFEVGTVNGHAKRYYESGVLKEEVDLKNTKLNGTRKYYYPNGQLWIEEVYKDGQHWTVVANYTEKGQKRKPGTLKNGDGTLIFYNEDGSIRQTSTFKNGEEVK